MQPCIDRILKAWIDLLPAFSLVIYLAPSNVSAEEAAGSGETQEVKIDDSAQQEEAANEPTSEEKINITGTRIARDNTQDYAHIMVIDASDIKISGMYNIGELLGILPNVDVESALGPTAGGYSYASLRNLSSSRTLVMINGKRVIGAAGTTVDLSNIPIAAVERIELLFDSASAIYGSDAIAGAINIIIKDDFNGVEVGANAGTATRGGAQSLGASMTTGVNGERGNLMLNFSWQHRSPVWARDRSWANPPCENIFNVDTERGYECQMGSPTVPGGTINYISLEPRFRIDHPGTIVFIGKDGQYYDQQPNYYDWLERYESGKTTDPYTQYNWNEQMSLSNQFDTFQLVTQGHYDLNDYMTAYMEGMYSYRMSAGRYAGEPVRPNNNALYYDGLNLPFSYPYIPEDFRKNIIDKYGITYIRAILDHSPLGPGVPYMRIDKRTNDLGARVTIDRANTFRAVTGLKGEITPDYKWDIFFNYGRYTDILTIQNEPDMQRLNIAINPEQCYATPGCILANIIGEGTMQPEAKDFIGFDATDTRYWDMINSGFQFVAQPFSLQGGKVGMVLGGDLRLERGYDAPDSKVLDGVSVGYDSEEEGRYNAQELFGELSFPILGKLPGAHILSLDLASRISHFSTFGTEFTYRAGLSYGPVEDIRFRGIVSTSYRSPAMLDMFGSTSSGYPEVYDPCDNGYYGHMSDYTRKMCKKDNVPSDYKQTEYYPRVESGANPDLDPETSHNLNLGIVITPTFFPESMPLIVTFDWYKVKVEDAIGAINAQDIVNFCYEVEGQQSFCRYITRNSDGSIDLIKAGTMNAMEIDVSGFDFAADLGFPIFKGFKGNIGFHGHYVLNYKTKYVGSSYDTKGYNEELGNPNAVFNMNFALGTSMWKINNRIRHWSGGIRPGAASMDPFYKRPGATYWDIAGTLKIKSFDIGIGLNNVTDPTPPFVPMQTYNTMLGMYDGIGRYVWTNVTWNFQ